MKLEDALKIWVEESGFRQVQDHLSKSVHSGLSKYKNKNMLESKGRYSLEIIMDVIETIRESMEPAKKDAVYYRGVASNIRNVHRREGFFSVTKDPSKAKTYGKVFKIIVSAEVPRLEFSAEGGEILLKDGLTYRYSGETIYVTNPKPDNSTLPYFGNLVVARQKKEKEMAAAKIESMLNQLFEFLKGDYDDIMGWTGTECSDEEYKQFKLLSAEKKLESITELIASVDQKKFKENFIEYTKFTKDDLSQIGL